MSQGGVSFKQPMDMFVSSINALKRSAVAQW